jgi:hypothetical protein
MDTKPKQAPYCNECGSTDVLADAYATWNIETQEWEILNIFDNYVCNVCGGECDIEWGEVS